MYIWTVPIVDAIVVGLVGSRLDEGAGIGVESRNRDSDVTVGVEDPAVGVLLQQLWSDDLLDGEHDAVLAADGDGRARFVDGLRGIVNLEDSSVGRELGRVEIVAGTDGTHFVSRD